VAELEEENDKLRERIDRMEVELNVLRTAASSGFQNQKQQNTMEEQLVSPAPSGGVTCDNCIIGKNCACLNDVVSESSAAITLPSTSNTCPEQASDDRCGMCSLESCLCEDLGIRIASSYQSKIPSPRSPTQGTKRRRSKSQSSPLFPSSPMEIDFTSSFSNSLPSSTQHGSRHNEGCGFCSNGAPCVCLPNTLPPLQSDLSIIVPETIRRGGVRRPTVDNVKILDGLIPRIGSPVTIASANGGCTGEPGTPLDSK
jgi:hypothetical protein